jgi:hypothetical protein
MISKQENLPSLNGLLKEQEQLKREQRLIKKQKQTYITQLINAQESALWWNIYNEQKEIDECSGY